MPDPAPRTVDDELTLAVERDAALLERLGTVLSIVDRLIDRVAELERDLSDERVARERLELRINAQWLRDRGYTLASAGELVDAAGSDDALGSRNVVPLIREYAADTDELPTTDAPTPHDGRHAG
jgi:hypothetical protein